MSVLAPPASGLPSLADLRSLAAHLDQGAPSQADRDAMVGLAREFEALFVLQMLKQMRQSVLESDPDQERLGLGDETMTELIDQELARHLSRAGGLGIADVISRALSAPMPSSGPVDPLGDVPPPNGGVLAAPVASGLPDPSPPTALPLPLASPITSAFGWRADPLTGEGRFHAGVDIRAAYGREVPAAGSGRVIAAGDQGGYGTTVVVEHEGGIQSRYAHLSALLVQAGDLVTAGQPVGRVGQTGRTTGPHLHFELVEDGRRVNPVLAVHRYEALAGLKGLDPVADSPNGRTTQPGTGADNED